MPGGYPWGRREGGGLFIPTCLYLPGRWGETRYLTVRLLPSQLTSKNLGVSTTRQVCTLLHLVSSRLVPSRPVASFCKVTQDQSERSPVPSDSLACPWPLAGHTHDGPGRGQGAEANRYSKGPESRYSHRIHQHRRRPSCSNQRAQLGPSHSFLSNGIRLGNLHPATGLEDFPVHAAQHNPAPSHTWRSLDLVLLQVEIGGVID